MGVYGMGDGYGPQPSGAAPPPMSLVGQVMPNNGGFNPSGAMGIGGTSIPLTGSPYSQMMTRASMMHARTNQAGSMGNQMAGAANPSAMRQIQDKFGGGGMAAATNANAPASTLSNYSGINSGGVRPGVVPEQNAVEAARAQGQGGPPPGMAGRNPNDPRNAVLGAYR